MATRGATAVAAAALLLASAFASCGVEDRPERSELPAKLRAAWDRLEARGYEVIAVRAVVGDETEGALLVDDGNSRVVVRASKDRGFFDAPLRGVLDAPGSWVPMNQVLTCGRTVEIAGSASRSIGEVARDSGLC
jgi:hypothetical protein